MNAPRIAALLGAVVISAGLARAQDSMAGGGSSYDPGYFGGRRYLQTPVYYPPNPPPLSAPLPAFNPTIGWPAPPWQVGDFLTDGLYPALSSRLEIGDLTKGMQARVDAYGARKVALLKELRAKLEATQSLGPAARERELAAFATTQAEALAQLETDADELRVDLTAGGFFHESVDWNYTRTWRLNEANFRTIHDGMIARLQVMRAASYYQEGFDPAQRRLLKEIAIEISDAIERTPPETDVNSTETPTASADANPVLFFLPETARFRLPGGLPAALRQKLSNFEARKSALKEELQASVAEKDSAIFSISRRHAAEALAKSQAAELAALEDLAEDIRRDFVNYPNAFRPPAPPDLPTPMVARMAAWVRERRTMQDSVFFLVEDIKKIVRVDRISYRTAPGTGRDAAQATGAPRRTLSIMVDPADQVEEKLNKVRILVEKHTDENRPRAMRLETERLAIRAEITRQLTARNPDINPAEVVSIIDESFETLDRVEEWAMYSDYRTAMLQPGMSPAQRRLLFDGAIRALNLPLPSEERSLRIMNQY